MESQQCEHREILLHWLEDALKQLTINESNDDGFRSHNHAIDKLEQDYWDSLQDEMNSRVEASEKCNVNPTGAEQIDELWLNQRNPLSGPRRRNDGVDELIQGIQRAHYLADGSFLVNMTLLVAGFIIGPSGATIRNIITTTGAKILSWTEYCMSITTRPFRVFVIKGSPDEVAHAKRIIFGAVCRYKELAEGKCHGQRVDSVQMVEGVEFIYRPPPKGRAPYAASIFPIAQRNSLHSERLEFAKSSGACTFFPAPPVLYSHFTGARPGAM